MQIEWSTFLLEVINFLVLMWILKRFLYQPVLGAIAKRKATIDRTLNGADTKLEEAKALEEQYRNRLADWGREKEQLRAALSEELAEQREHTMSELRVELDRQRETDRVLAARQMAELERQAEERGAAAGVRFTGRLLNRVAGPELEAKLVALVIEDLRHLQDAQREPIEKAFRDSHPVPKIASAFPLTGEQRTALIEALHDIAQENVSPTFAEERDLIAGVRIGVGPWTIRANLQDELAFFSEMVNHDLRTSLASRA